MHKTSTKPAHPGRRFEGRRRRARPWKPTEGTGHAEVAAWLRMNLEPRRGPMLATHPANEEPNADRRLQAWRMGVEKGAPDFLIFRRPPAFLEASGVAIELKAEAGVTSEAQAWWLEELAREGWITARIQPRPGEDLATLAISFLRGCGYGAK